MINFNQLPASLDFMDWTWEQIEPYFQDLSARQIDPSNVEAWLADWTHIHELIDETRARLDLACTQNTADELAESRFLSYLENVYMKVQSAEQKLKEKLLASGLTPRGFDLPLKKMHSEADLFREENLPLFTQEEKISSEYNKTIGGQTVTWEGEEFTLTKLRSRMVVPERDLREKIWKTAIARQLKDRPKINNLWAQFMDLRKQVADNAGRGDYRSYKWQQLQRFDYSPEDSKRFHESIFEVAVPAAARIYEKHRRKMGIESTRPWDLDLDLYPINLPAIQAYTGVEELKERASAVFHQVSAKTGGYFDLLRQKELLDLDNRKNKAPGAYCTQFVTLKTPFIFMNGVGRAEDVRTLFHESGHGFHVFERSALPFYQQRRSNMEFNEVASMSMEFLTLPYITRDRGGFFDPQTAARVRIQQLERAILFWPYMAVVDGFNHWVYENHQLARDPSACDAAWSDLWDRFIPGQDWSGLEDEKVTGWHRKLHIHTAPFYYVEYGLAQLGAVQVWSNALRDRDHALEMYLKALSLGGTVTLTELYRAAGVKLSFDAQTLKQAVDLLEEKIAEYEM